MTGDAGFNEVFFEDVRVPRANLVGELQRRLEVANATLVHERNMLGVDHAHAAAASTACCASRARARATASPASADPVVRQRLADLAIRVETMKLEALPPAHRRAPRPPAGHRRVGQQAGHHAS